MEDFFVSNPEIVLKEELDEALLLNPDTGEIKLLNETGLFIYKLLDGKTSQNDIVNKLVSKFETEDTKQAEKDVVEFLNMLFEMHLIGRVN